MVSLRDAVAGPEQATNYGGVGAATNTGTDRPSWVGGIHEVLDKLATTVTKPAEGKPPDIRQATVTAVNVGPPKSVDIQIGGCSGLTVPGVRYLIGAAIAPHPLVGDVIWVLINDKDVIMLGVLA